MSSFKDVIGHKDIIEYVQNAVTNNKVSHAYILNGERGSGKKMLAQLFARTLLCENSAIEPCNKCKSCVQAEGNNNPDIISVVHDKPNTISIDDIRTQVNNDIMIKPYAGEYKVYIIPEADKMTEQAQNAILKTIEEPPSYAIIFLITENADALLPTIQSRCVMLKLRNVRDALVKAYLMQQMHVPEYQANVCAAFAQGNIGKAKMLATSEHFNEIKEDSIKLMRNINEMDIAEITSSVKNITNFKLDIVDYLDVVSIWYRDVLIYKATKNLDRVIFQDEIEKLKERAMKSSYEGLEVILLAIEKAKSRLRANVNFDLVMELLLLTIKEN